jgi:DNA-binding Lrp family transcriptional regulator
LKWTCNSGSEKEKLQLAEEFTHLSLTPPEGRERLKNIKGSGKIRHFGCEVV